MVPSYNPSVVVDLLSRDRMAPYKRPLGQWRQVSDLDALRAYTTMMDDQSRYWVFIGGVEVVFRNALDAELYKYFGDWTESDEFYGLLADEDKRRLDDAWRQCEEENRRRTSNLRRRNPKAPATNIERGHVVAALSFGFWRRMLIKSYDLDLWVPALNKAFLPQAKSTKGTLLDAASHINVERNRLAHHERLLNPSRLKTDGLLLTGAVSPDARMWLDSLI